jgi:hypothetical protein
MENELRPFWSRLFNFDWKLGLFLLLLICIPRFILVLDANASGDYGYIGLIMLLSAIAPFVFLSRFGRKKIGLVRTRKYKWLAYAFVGGLAASILLHFIGQSLYGNTVENWYYYIGRSYKIPAEITVENKTILFAIIAFTSMTFSPFGEELFFRGIVHSSIAKSVGDKKASFADSLAFALTHISHFCLIYINAEWTLLTIPTIIWVASMFLVSIMFFVFRQYSESIWGAVIGHSAFNLGMTYCIFFLM